MRSFHQRKLERQKHWTELPRIIPLGWRREWQPIPVFLPGESQRQRSLVGCRLWGRTESDTTEATAAASSEDKVILD